MRHEIKKPNDKVNKKKKIKKKIQNVKKKIIQKLYNNKKKIESNSSLLDWS